MPAATLVLCSVAAKERKLPQVDSGFLGEGFRIVKRKTGEGKLNAE